jgi:hypothetical protein
VFPGDKVSGRCLHQPVLALGTHRDVAAVLVVGGHCCCLIVIHALARRVGRHGGSPAVDPVWLILSSSMLIIPRIYLFIYFCFETRMNEAPKKK